jgi:histidyl-tRNA synthetase
LLKELGINDGVTLQLNTLGDTQSRDAWRAALIAYFNDHKNALSEDSLARLEKNPLRILNSKDPKDRPIADAAPVIDDYLSGEAQDFFGAVTEGLDAAGVAWERNARLVRGLDYYRHTAFEFVTDRLGAQGTVLGGGRYDGLIENLGGNPTPAVGWAAGIERLAMLVDEPASLTKDMIAVVPDEQLMETEAHAIASALRRRQLSVFTSFKGNPKKQSEKAKQAGAVAILYVRNEADPKRRLHLTNVTLETDQATPFLLKILGMLPDQYSELSGDDDRA